MQDRKDQKIEEAWEIDPEEFDRVQEPHVFSEAYCRRKKKMLRKYCRGSRLSPGKYAAQAAITILAVLFLIVPFSVYADVSIFPEVISQRVEDAFESNLVEPLSNIVSNRMLSKWIGWMWKDTGDSVTGDDEPEFPDLFAEPIAIPIGDTTMNVLAAFSDGTKAVMVFSLEKEGGVTLLESDPQGRFGEKEMLFSRDDHYMFHFESANCRFYKDKARSTDSKMYFYAYVTAQKDAIGEDHLTLKLADFPCTLGEYWDQTYGLNLKIKETSFEVPLALVQYSMMQDPSGRKIGLSPFSLRIYGSGNHNAHFSNIESIRVRYRTGREYVVLDDEDRIYDYNEASYTESEGYTDVFFDRLVNLDEVESIVINGTEYR